MKTIKYPKTGYEKDPEAFHRYIKDIRILTPKEYEALKAAIPRDHHKIIFDILLITGMKYIELLRLYDNEEWYNERQNVIHIPKEIQKRSQRTIYPLPSMFSHTMKAFLQSNKPPSEAIWNQNLQRWARSANMSPYGFSAKTTRKSIEAWMIAAGVTESAVCLRHGHGSLNSMLHYQSLTFSDEELKEIMKKLIEWEIVK